MNNSTKYNVIILLASLVLLGGCQLLGLTVVNTLARMQKAVVVRDIGYGSEERQRLVSITPGTPLQLVRGCT